MNEDGQKFVEFEKYCPTCEHKDKRDMTLQGDIVDIPCHECLNNPVNLYSNKPVNYQKKN